MESKVELKEIDIKNRMCYYFDDTMRVSDIYFNDILLDQKSYENILIHDIRYKTFMSAKLLQVKSKTSISDKNRTQTTNQ